MRTTIMILLIFIVNILSAQGSLLKKHILLVDINENEPVYKTAPNFKLLKNSIFIVDNFGHQVLEYKIENKLKFSKKMGQRGVGPGDLNLPAQLSIFNSKIAIKDELGYSFFKKDGSFLKKFRMFSPTSSFVYINNKIYCVVQNPNTQALIEVYSDSGEKTKDIGKKYIKLDKIYNNSKNKGINPFHVDQYFYRNMIVANHNTIYYFDLKFGLAFKFSEAGKLLLKKDISPLFGKEGKRVVEKNEEILNSSLPIKQNIINDYPIIWQVCRAGKNIYLFCNENFNYKKIINAERKNQILRIRVLNEMLELIGKYEIPYNRSKERFYSAEVIEVNGKPVVYFSASNNEYDNFFAVYK